MIHSFLGTGLRCPRCQSELVSDIEATDGSTILREVLSCPCGHQETVVEQPWDRAEVRRRIAIVRGAA